MSSKQQEQKKEPAAMGAQNRLHLTATKISKDGQLQQQLSIGAGIGCSRTPPERDHSSNHGRKGGQNVTLAMRKQFQIPAYNSDLQCPSMTHVPASLPHGRKRDHLTDSWGLFWWVCVSVLSRFSSFVLIGAYTLLHLFRHNQPTRNHQDHCPSVHLNSWTQHFTVVATASASRGQPVIWSLPKPQRLQAPTAVENSLLLTD